MQRRRKTLLVSLPFLLTALAVVVLGKTPVIASVFEQFAQRIVAPIGSTFLRLTRLSNREADTQRTLRQENERLSQKLVDEALLERENRALKDQFQTTAVRAEKLLPATVLAMPRFVPGVTQPTTLTLDKGEREGVRVGQGVVVRDVLVGKVSKTSRLLSEVTLVVNPQFSLAARTLATGTLGVVRATAEGVIFGNVLLSDELFENDTVVTLGEGEGTTLLPPNLVVGTITSVERKPSALFQSAKIKSPIALQKLDIVFVFVGLKQ